MSRMMLCTGFVVLVAQSLSLNELQIRKFEIEVGAMEYGYEIDGIIGTDFLTQVGAIIDLHQMELYPSNVKE